MCVRLIIHVMYHYVYVCLGTGIHVYTMLSVAKSQSIHACVYALSLLRVCAVPQTVFLDLYVHSPPCFPAHDRCACLCACVFNCACLFANLACMYMYCALQVCDLELC